MLSKLFLATNLIFSSIPVIKTIQKNIPLYFTGEYMMCEVNKPIELRFYLLLFSSNSNVTLKIFENNNTLIFNKSFKSEDLEAKTIILNEFTKNEEKKEIRIEIYYTNDLKSTVSSSFNIYSAPQKDITINNLAESEYFSPPVVTIFSSQKQTPTYYYENFILGTDYKKIILSDTRFLDFSRFDFIFSSYPNYLYPKEILMDFEINYRFLNADFKENDYYYIINSKAIQINEGRYKGEDEYRFYLDRYNGEIYENENENISGVIYPFFLPLYIEAQTEMDYIVTFKDVGLCKNNYILYGNIIIENELFGYTENSKFTIDEISSYFDNIDYEE